MRWLYLFSLLIWTMQMVVPSAGAAENTFAAVNRPAVSASAPTSERDSGAAVDLGLDEVSVKSFGARGDGVTDDTAAINAAADYIRKAVKAADGGRGVLLRFPQGAYRVRGSLNFTNIRGKDGIYWGLEGENANILGEAAGKPIFDFMNSLGGRMRGFNIAGDEKSKPSCAIQLSRGGQSAKGAPVSADNFTLEFIRTFGYYTLAALYNFGSERFLAYSCTFGNADLSEDSYAVVIDGRNRFAAKSDYFNNELPVNDPVSCLNQLFIKCSFLKTPGGPGVGPAIYLTRTSRVKMIGCYAVSYTNAAVVLDGDVSGFNDIEFDLHCEPTGKLQNALRFTSSFGAKAYSVDAFRWTENSLHAQVAAIASDGPTVTLNDAVIQILGRQGKTSVPLFTPGSRFKVSGAITCQPAHALLPSDLTLQGTYTPGGSVDSAFLPKGTYVIEGTAGTGRVQKGEERWYGTAAEQFAGAELRNRSVAAIASGSLFLGHSGGEPAVTFGVPENEAARVQMKAYDAASSLRFQTSPDNGVTWRPSLAILPSGAIRLPALAALPAEKTTGGEAYYNVESHSLQAYRGGTAPMWGEIPLTLRGVEKLDFPPTPAQASNDLTIKVAGVSVGDEVLLGPSATAVLPNSAYSAFVALEGRITVRFNNFSKNTLDPPADFFRVSVVKR